MLADPTEEQPWLPVLIRWINICCIRCIYIIRVQACCVLTVAIMFRIGVPTITMVKKQGSLTPPIHGSDMGTPRSVALAMSKLQKIRRKDEICFDKIALKRLVSGQGNEQI